MTGKAKKLLPALASGLLLLAAMPGRPGFAWLAWLALVPLLRACRTAASHANAAWLGLGTGMVFYPLALSWITIVLGTYGHLEWWVSGAALLLLSLYMSLYLALFAAGCRWFAPHLPLVWVAPPLWVGLDLIRTRLFTGFPWLDLAYSQFRTPLPLQCADLCGHHGVTFLIVLANAVLLTVLAPWLRLPTAPPPDRRRELLLVALPAVLLLAASLIYGAWRLPQVAELDRRADQINVAVVQGNIPQDEKWSPSYQRRTVDRYLALSEAALASPSPPSLLVWPETALPFYPLESPLFSEVVERVVHRRRAALLSGAPHRERSAPNEPPRYFNSAFLVEPADYPLSGMQLPLADRPPFGRLAGRYDKQHLVPFGEYIPLRSILPFLAPVVETMGDFTPGRATGPITCQNARIGVLICYESIFADLARREVSQGANLLANITNDAWFGRSNAPWQHLAMSVFRAVENRRGLARAANTGFSGAIDPTGRITALTELFTADSRTVHLPLLAIETVFDRFGHLFARLCLLLLVPAAILRLQRARRPATPQ